MVEHLLSKPEAPGSIPTTTNTEKTKVRKILTTPDGEVEEKERGEESFYELAYCLHYNIIL